MRDHIRDQIDARIVSMDQTCYNEGSCQICGCSTTALQMANKACDKPCYPAMLSKSDWKDMKLGCIHYDEETKTKWLYNGVKFIKQK